MINNRRFGTAKRLKQIRNYIVGYNLLHRLDCFFGALKCTLRDSIDFKYLYSINHSLTFGSAKPTGIQQ